MQPDVQIPIDRNGIVVQLFVEERPVLRVGRFMNRHYRVLEEALNEFGLSFRTEQRRNYNIPTLEGEKYKVVGMGLYVCMGNEILFRGKSLDYKIGINKEHLELCQYLILDKRLTCVD